MCSRDREGTANGSVTLSRVSILVGFICASSYFGAFVGTGWVYTKEPYRLTNLNLYTTVTFKIGLWRACHSFKRINSTITPLPSCTEISYTNWSKSVVSSAFQRSDIESTINVIGRIRWCAVLVGLGFILILIGFVCSVAGHFYKDNKTLLASAMYTLSGLSLAAGLFVLVCVLTDSFSIHTSISGDPHPNEALDSRRKTYHDYEYGWCFLVAGTLCVFVEMVSLLCITVHQRRCQTIAQIIKNILPVEEQQKPTTTTDTSYFSSGDVNYEYIEKIDPCKSENKTKPNDESFATSETPPDICSTFLNVEYAEDVGSRPCDVTEHLDICSSRMKKGNFATLNTRNYRCLKYPSSLSRRYSAMSGCSSIPGTALDGPSSSSSSSSTRPNTKCHQSTTSCIQSTMPRVRNTPGGISAKFATVDRQCKKNEIQAEVQTLDSDNFGL